jgi:hypothetical protein
MKSKPKHDATASHNETPLVRVNYPGRPATTILAGGGGGMFG